jgi:hypothetical protein
LTLALFPAVFAHRLDECLQATRVSVFQGHLRIQTYVTPGTLLAAAVFASIDADGSGAISESEGREYAEKFLRGMTLQMDGVVEPLALISSHYPTMRELMDGEAMIRFEMSAAAPVKSGHHRVLLQNNNDPATSIYLANAMLPEDTAISIVHQDRDQTQRSLAVEYDLRSPMSATTGASVVWTSSLTGILLGLGAVFIVRKYLRRRSTGTLNPKRNGAG